MSKPEKEHVEASDNQPELLTLISAFQAGITRLYHYEPFKPEHLGPTLQNYQVHCSNPANLNDPWDCRPSFNTSLLNNPQVREKSIEWLQALPSSTPLSAEADAYLTLQMYNIPSFPAETIDSISDSFRDIALNRWRIYCLTPHPDSTLMWSHYADNHRGICLEFASDNNVLFARALQVIYRGAYPQWSVHASNDYIQVMITKSDDWLYENEYRVIARAGKGASNPDTTLPVTVGDYLPLPAGSLISVIAGCEADLLTIQDVVSEYMPSLPIKYAVRDPRQYRLYIDVHPPRATRNKPPLRAWEFRYS